MPVLLLGVVAGLVVAVRWADHEIAKIAALKVDTCLPMPTFNPEPLYINPFEAWFYPLGTLGVEEDGSSES